MLHSIHAHEKRLREQTQSRFTRFCTAVQLLFLYVAFALHRGVILLFANPTKSFVLVHNQDEKGMWHASYDEHVRFQKKVRFFSASTFCVLLTSIGIVWGVLNVVFPQGNAPFAYAAANTFYVTNANDSGAGSLRQAISDANGSDPSDTNTIELDLFGQPTVSLLSALPPINRHVEFVNSHAVIALVIEGGALTPGTPCMSLSDGASNAVVVGVALSNCPTAIALNGTISGVLIGDDTVVDAERVQIWGGNTGLTFASTVATSTIKNVVIGQNLLGAASALSGTGIEIAGYGNTITGSHIGNAAVGVELSGNENTIVSSFIGIATSPVVDADMGNSGAGILISGEDNRIGGTISAEQNVISYNGGDGITIQGSGAQNNRILLNYIGLNTTGVSAAGNGESGIAVLEAGANLIGSSAEWSGPVVAANGGDGITVSDASVTVQYAVIGASANQTTLLGNGQSGVRFFAVGAATTGTVLYSFIAGNGADGVSFDQADGDVRVEQNSIQQNGSAGVAIQNASSGTVTIADNTIEENSGVAGIFLNAVTGVTINQNSLTGSSSVDTHGIQLIDVADAEVYDNTITGHGDAGLIIEGEGSAQVHNTIIQSSMDGVVFYNTHDGDWNVYDNAITDNLHAGVYVVGSVESAAIVIADNNVSQNSGAGASGVVVEDSVGVVVDHNRIADNTGSGVVIAGSSTSGITLTQNSIYANGSVGIDLQGGANQGILAPTVTGATAAAIFGTGAYQGGRVELFANGVYVGSDESVGSDGKWFLAAAEYGQSVEELLGQEVTATNSDDGGNTSEFSNAVVLGAQTITITPTVVVTKTTASITVDTNLATTASVVYGTASDQLVNTLSDVELLTSHTFTLTGLTAGTSYYYRVDVVAEDTETASTSVATFTTTSAPTTTLDFSYATNAYVNGQRVFNPATNLFVAPGGVKIKLFPAHSGHDVKLTVRDEEKNIVLQGEWQHVNSKTFLQVLEGLQKDERYTVHAQARETTSTKTRSEKQKIATVTLTRKAPTLTSLEGDYTVTTNSQQLTFSGLTNAQLESQFRFQNSLTGAIVATCGNPCELPFALAPGEYTVLYESLSRNGVPSAPATHHLVVTRARTTSVFNTDKRNDQYSDRIVSSRFVTVVGLGPEGATATVRVNGVSVGTATYDTKIGWSYVLDTSRLSRNHKQLLEVVYTNANGKKVAESVYYPFLTSDPVSTPVVSDLAAEYERTASFTFTVTADVGARINVLQGDQLVYAADVEDGTVEVPVLTTQLGVQRLTITAENSLGVHSGRTAEASYAVVTEITQAQTQGDSQQGEDATDNQNSEEGQNEEPDSETPLTDAEEMAKLLAVLNKQNTESIQVIGEQRVLDRATGDVVSTRTIANTPEGEQVLRHIVVNGITTDIPFFSSFFGALRKTTSDVLVISGVTQPRALVTVTIHSDPIVQVTRADTDGQWTMTIPADALPVGEHTAYVQTSARGVESDQVEIAKFVVVEQQTISNTTWIFIANLSVAIILLLVVITLQIRGKQRSVESTSAAVQQPVQSVEKPATTPQSTKDDDDKPDYHSALGV